jgi:hypothetical protein
MRTPNYHDFYQMAFIPIGSRDFVSLKESDSFTAKADHWLIAVEGVLLPQPKIYYYWRVSVYPAASDQDFDWKKPYYCSESMPNMDWAIAHAATLIAASKHDRLSAKTIIEKIS